MFGLKQENIDQINSVFHAHGEIERVLLYGSRAKGNYKNGSDIDLTIIGKNIGLSLLQKIELELDDLYLPYKIDLSIFRKISNEELIDHIERVGQDFYVKNS